VLQISIKAVSVKIILEKKERNNLNRVYNFSAGPSMLPLSVLRKVQSEFLNYNGSGMSVLELSHRSNEYDGIHDTAKKNLKKLMDIPDAYEILFLQGGATLQFSAIPLNLQNAGKADYIITGSWADKAYKEAAKILDAKIVASSKEKNYSYIPKVENSSFRKDIDYVHITLNNTIYGTKFNYIPETKEIPLVCDLSSGILSDEINVSKFGLIYAGAQKNIGPAGLTVVIIKKDLIKDNKNIPTYLSYKTHMENNSLYNTPPVFSIYFAGKVFKNLLDMGGLSVLKKLNHKKAELLYDFIDSSSLFSSPVNRTDRSIMNVVFITGDEKLDKKFIEEAKNVGLVNLNGHRSIGGMRASIYNAMPIEGVEKLILFMKKFERENK
jgi:phosphoserine aminotransferase